MFPYLVFAPDIFAYDNNGTY